MKRKLAITFFLGLIFSSFILVANYKSPNDYKFHSIYIYNFTKYIEWPASGGDFQLSILGNDPGIYESFKKMAEAKNVSGSKIIVKQLNNLNAAGECDILFIPQDQSSNASQAINLFRGKNTLIITENKGLAEQGSGINFVLVDNRLKFEINKSAIEASGLKVSSQLLQMGIVK